MSRSQQTKNDALHAAALVYDSDSSCVSLMPPHKYGHEYDEERGLRYIEPIGMPLSSNTQQTHTISGRAIRPPRLADRPHGISRLLLLFVCLVCVGLTATISVALYVLPLYDRFVPPVAVHTGMTARALPRSGSFTHTQHRVNVSRDDFAVSLHKLRRQLDELDARLQL